MMEPALTFAAIFLGCLAVLWAMDWLMRRLGRTPRPFLIAPIALGAAIGGTLSRAWELDVLASALTYGLCVMACVVLAELWQQGRHARGESTSA